MLHFATNVYGLHTPEDCFKKLAKQCFQLTTDSTVVTEICVNKEFQTNNLFSDHLVNNFMIIDLCDSMHVILIVYKSESVHFQEQ